VSCDYKRLAISSHIRFLEVLGKPLRPGARILDFGCGIGESVEMLLDMGYDAYGVDTVDWWHRNDCWDKSYLPHERIKDRLKRIDEANYSIPFPDGNFDFCFSDQVLEHVCDYSLTFSEIVRVLKPRALSVHRFPGPNVLMEGHLFLPFPMLCYFKPYLAFWAILGRRAPGQKDHHSWRQTLDANVNFMSGVSYPSKRRLRQYAARAGVNITFFEKEELRLRTFGNAGKLVSRARQLRLDGFLASILSPFTQRYMVLEQVRSADEPRFGGAFS
jgi:SAM-dependent methyltransferase